MLEHRLDVLIVLFNQSGVDEYVIYVFQYDLLSYLPQDYIQSPVEWSGRISQTKWHSRGVEETSMTGEESFFPTLFGYLHLPVTAIGVQCVEDFCIPQRIDTFVHSRYWIQIPDRSDV